MAAAPRTRRGSSVERAVMSIPKLETAKTGRSTCRGCGEVIAQGALRLGVDAFVSGRVVTTWQHLTCALNACYLERCVASRGKCKATGVAFKKGDVRLAVCSKDVKTFYACDGDAMGAAMRAAFDAVEGFHIRDVKGFDELTSEESAAVMAAMEGGGDDDRGPSRDGNVDEEKRGGESRKRDAGEVDVRDQGGNGAVKRKRGRAKATSK